MKVDNTHHIGIGAIAGTTAGTAAGLLAGRERAKTIMGDFGNYVGLNKDQYVSLKTTLAEKRMIEGGIKENWIAKNIGKVTLKADQDFPAVQERLQVLTKQAKKAKLGWLAGIAAAGTVIGAGIGLLRKNKKAEED